MKGKKFINIIIIISIIVIISFLGVSMLNEEEKKSFINVKEKETTIYLGSDEYLDLGVLSNKDGIITLYDNSSGITAPLCDKPNCNHRPISSTNPTSTCNAAVENTEFVAMYNNKLYFMKSVEGEKTSSQFLYQADLNGSNREQIAEIENVNQIFKSKFIDGKLLLVTVQIYEEDTLKQLEVPKYDVVIVDLTSYKVDCVTKGQVEAYPNVIDQVEYIKSEDSILYTKTITRIDNTNTEEDSNKNGMSIVEIRKRHKNTFTQLWLYNTNSKESKMLKESNATFTMAIANTKVVFVEVPVAAELEGVIITKAYIYDYKDNTQKEIEAFKYDNFYYNGKEIYTTSFENNIRIFYSLNINTGKFNKITTIKDGMLNGLSSNYIFITMKDKKGDEWIYSLAINDFLKADLKKAKEIRKAFTE